MAGDSVFLGILFKNMTDKLAAVVTALEAHTVKLNNINTVVAQGVNYVNVAPSTTDLTVTFAADKSASFSTGQGSTWRTAATIASFGVGQVQCDFTVNSDGPNNIIKIGYSLNSGSNWNEIMTIGTPVTNKAISFNLPVINGSVLIGFNVNAINNTNTIKAGSTMKYKLLDIVNSNQFVIS